MKLYVVHCLDLVRRGGSHDAAQDSLELKETPSLSLSHNWNHRYISPAEENLKVFDGTLQKRNWRVLAVRCDKGSDYPKCASDTYNPMNLLDRDKDDLGSKFSSQSLF